MGDGFSNLEGLNLYLNLIEREVRRVPQEVYDLHDEDELDRASSVKLGVRLIALGGNYNKLARITGAMGVGRASSDPAYPYHVSCNPLAPSHYPIRLSDIPKRSCRLQNPCIVGCTTTNLSKVRQQRCCCRFELQSCVPTFNATDLRKGGLAELIQGRGYRRRSS